MNKTAKLTVVSPSTTAQTELIDQMVATVVSLAADPFVPADTIKDSCDRVADIAQGSGEILTNDCDALDWIESIDFDVLSAFLLQRYEAKK